MASTIITKYGSGAPLASDLVRGELAVDTENGRLYTEDSLGAVVEIGLNPGGNLDVTGTVTADGLTVDGDGTLQTSDGAILTLKSTDTVVVFEDIYGSLQFESSDATNPGVVSKIDAIASGGNGGSILKFYTSDNTSTLERLNISFNGDISFYEDTGTTAKFFWDASAERLDLSGSDYQFGITQGANQPWYLRGVSDGSFRIHLNATGDVLTIDSSGQVTVSGTGSTTYSTSKGVVVDYSTSSTSNVLPIGFSWSNSIGDTNPLWGMGFIPTNYGSGIADLGFYTGGSERMRIDSSGNLYCSGGSGGTILTLTSSSGTTGGDIGRIRFGNNNIDSNLVNIVAFQDGATDSGGLKFETQPTAGATTEAMRIDSGGRLLVSETTNLGTRFVIEAGNSSAAEGALFGLLTVGRSGSGYPIVGYNCEPTTTALTYNRHSNDYASWVDFLTGQVRTFTTTSIGTGTTTGTAGPYVAGGGTSWTSSSDQRFKDNVQGITYGLDAVKSLNPVSYVRNDRDTGETELGFIAQEVESVVQEVVNVDPDGYYGLNYERLVPVLTKAIQEQQDLIESLTARIAALEGAN